MLNFVKIGHILFLTISRNKNIDLKYLSSYLLISYTALINKCNPVQAIMVLYLNLAMVGQKVFELVCSETKKPTQSSQVAISQLAF